MARRSLAADYCFRVPVAARRTNAMATTRRRDTQAPDDRYARKALVGISHDLTIATATRRRSAENCEIGSGALVI